MNRQYTDLREHKNQESDKQPRKKNVYAILGDESGVILGDTRKD